MDTKKPIIKGEIYTAKTSKIQYRLERIIPVRKAKSVENELHFISLEPHGIDFKMSETDFLNNSVFIIQK